MKLLVSAVVLAVWALPAPACQATTYIDEGACPFECCVYGAWTARARTPVHAEPNTRSRQTGVVEPGADVEALGGHVATRGAAFVVSRRHRDYLPGEVLTVYTYHGEGVFTVQRDGRRFQEDLGFSPYGGSAGSRCEAHEDCWGTLSQPLQMQWWARVRLPNGHLGWVQASRNFSGQSGCD